jgi:hypothetical protein
VGQWIDPRRRIRHRPKHPLPPIAVIVAKLHGELSFGPFTVTDVNTQAKIEYQQVLRKSASRPLPARILPEPSSTAGRR